jgi:hypothetical protein
LPNSASGAKIHRTKGISCYSADYLVLMVRIVIVKISFLKSILSERMVIIFSIMAIID